jgi:ABC-type glutathione transport system ATPase component
VLSTLRRAQDQRRFATILVTHDHSLASRFGDRVVWLDDGRLVASAAPHPVLPGDMGAAPRRRA